MVLQELPQFKVKNNKMSSNSGNHPDQKQKFPPATPVYVLRGHTSPIHALDFFSENSRLISGDADGWVLVWNMSTKRPVAVWKAHDSAVLGVYGVDFEACGTNNKEKRLFTHGRDHALRVWRLNVKDEDILDKTLPVDDPTWRRERNEPWLIHSLTVNALNFCPFASCFLPYEPLEGPKGSADLSNFSASPDANTQVVSAPPSFLSVPNALNTGGVDIFHLPSERRVSTISPDPSINTGMVMALRLFFSVNDDLYVISGYEDGRVMVHIQRRPVPDILNQGENRAQWTWEKLYMHQAHSQPVLSLDTCPMMGDQFLTSSADALIVKHPIPIPPGPQQSVTSKPEALLPLKVMNTKHAGQQGLRIRTDGKIYITAGWDSRTRVYSYKSMKELAALKWHKEGCYAIALADVDVSFDNDTVASAPIDTSQAKPEWTEPTDENRNPAMIPQPGSLAAIKLRRSQKAQLTHWVAAGSKDGKISLWDIY